MKITIIKINKSWNTILTRIILDLIDRFKYRLKIEYSKSQKYFAVQNIIFVLRNYVVVMRYCFDLDMLLWIFEKDFESQIGLSKALKAKCYKIY